ncbi:MULTISPECIES: aminotransferase class V-fold PLP-dependent enzyme [Yersinia]|uniref:aminotransferase class V-fold PLP-dependent enzyme n=1 Tax=Yersinia TaxID=629 RepID=UPI001C61088E|nr:MULTISPECIES: aminotransferase class V-fold PLP-dependent enzyme [Yersinia]MBW5818868.1 aminotransferase class V-fold PLP-dependent enzyme [Yersinia kristensenii]MBW5835862.1 aminotransferase class V-fold PLP-dependent enzyme [Yersinia enterocolitica]MDA5491621.1 aminotransferase class V-fold PLP-dependent enzyme [Yersinia kristensenii]
MSYINWCDMDLECQDKYESELIVDIKKMLNDQTKPENNLGTYTTTLMDADVSELFESLLPYNKVNQHEYPKIKQMENYCLSFMLDMIHAQSGEKSFGVSTNGSSEAILLACMSWKHNNNVKDVSNIIISKNAHSSWIKIASILGLEIKEVTFDASSFEDDMLSAIDNKTIGIGVTLGTTSTGLFEPIELINDFLESYNDKFNRFIPIHVDAASGGFIAPFKYPDFIWDFRLTHVESINISGHKYGMVYPSVGWLFWKDKDKIPRNMIIPVEYLKNDFTHIGVNFSAPAAYIVAQYYNLKRYGFLGYQNKVSNLYRIKLELERELKNISLVVVISDDDRYRLPVVCWSYKNPDLYEVISKRFDELGWVVPHCKISRGDNERCFRIVIRHNFDNIHFQKLIDDLKFIHTL